MFVFRIAGQDSFGFTVNPNIGTTDSTCDIQYNDKYKCIGFESLCPSVGLMLYEHGLPKIDSIVKLSVSIHHTSKGLIYYQIEKPNESILGNTRKADIVFYSSGRIDITSHTKQTSISRGCPLILWARTENYIFMSDTAHQPAVGMKHVFHPIGKGNISEPHLKTVAIPDVGRNRQGEIMRWEPKESHHGTLLPIITKLLCKKDMIKEIKYSGILPTHRTMSAPMGTWQHR